MPRSPLRRRAPLRRRPRAGGGLARVLVPPRGGRRLHLPRLRHALPVGRARAPLPARGAVRCAARRRLRRARGGGAGHVAGGAQHLHGRAPHRPGARGAPRRRAGRAVRAGRGVRRARAALRSARGPPRHPRRHHHRHLPHERGAAHARAALPAARAEGGRASRRVRDGAARAHALREGGPARRGLNQRAPLAQRRVRRGRRRLGRGRPRALHGACGGHHAPRLARRLLCTPTTARTTKRCATTPSAATP